MREALRARDEVRLGALRMAIAAIRNRRIELRRDLTDREVVALLGVQLKQRRESEELYRAGRRPELAQRERDEAEALAAFMPPPIGHAELEALVRSANRETGASGPADLGRVMGRVVPQVRGRVDGAALSGLVRSLLAEHSAVD